jgi:hypothetical protein
MKKLFLIVFCISGISAIYAFSDIRSYFEEEESDEAVVITSSNVMTNADLLTAFVGMLDGFENNAQKAVQQYASRKIVKEGIIPFGNNAVVISESGNCSLIQTSFEETVNEYSICLKNGKIDKLELVKWKGEVVIPLSEIENAQLTITD